jgi:hypothetical protein
MQPRTMPRISNERTALLRDEETGGQDNRQVKVFAMLNFRTKYLNFAAAYRIFKRRPLQPSGLVEREEAG